MARKAKPENSEAQDEPSGLHPLLRLLVSSLLLLHLAGIFLAPLATSINVAYQIFPNRAQPFLPVNQPTPPVSELPQEPAPPAGDLAPRINSETSANLWLLKKLEPYLDLCYLNHGYNFFAPDPGDSMLIHYKIERADGSEYEGTFPDIRKQWPRLRYHRHFMLSSHSIGMPEGTANAYGQHLLRTYQGQRATLELVRHRLLTQQEVLDGKTIDDPSTFETLDSLVVNLQQDPPAANEGEPLPTPEARR